MLKNITICIMMFCLFGGGIIIAQDAPLAMLRFVATVSERLDRLQHRLDATPLGNPGAAHIDYVTQSYAGEVIVSSWGFVCNEPGARIAVVVDSVETENGPSHPDRQDVVNAYAGLCAVPLANGANFLVDMHAFASGFQGDGVHTFRVRVYNAAGAMFDSQTVTATTW